MENPPPSEVDAGPTAQGPSTETPDDRSEAGQIPDGQPPALAPASQEQAPTTSPAPEQQPLWRGKILPVFWTVASVISLSFNIILVVIVLYLVSKKKTTPPMPPPLPPQPPQPPAK